jgi:hypothetical protein
MVECAAEKEIAPSIIAELPLFTEFVDVVTDSRMDVFGLLAPTRKAFAFPAELQLPALLHPLPI